MTLADKVTSLRLVLAPVFFVVYLLPRFFPDLAGTWTVPVLWALFVISELTDMLDGQLARRLKQGSDFGKLFDPFADTLTQLTYFLCFVLEGILPSPLFLLVLYREYSVLFIRNLMLRRGIAMGARLTGKLKTVAYILAAAFALLALSLGRLGLRPDFIPSIGLGARIVFGLSVVLSMVSFLDYVALYRKTAGSPGMEKKI